MRAEFLGRWVLGGLLGLGPLHAWAGVGFEEGTRLWQGPAPAEARERAEAWARAVRGRVVAVRASPERDEFVETLAILECNGPIPSGDDARVLLGHEVAPLVPGAPDPLEASVERRDGEQPLVVIGRFESEAITYRTALVSAGPSHAIVVLATQSREDSLYRGRFTEALARLQGIERPLSPFPRLAFRVASVLASFGLALGAWFVLMRRPSARAIAVGLGAAAITLGAAVIASCVTLVVLAGAEAELLLAGTTRGGVITDLVVIAIAAAGLALGLSLWQRTREGPIQSAPAQGAFAERLPATPRPSGSKPDALSKSILAERLPATPPATELRRPARARPPGHPDGPSVLDDPGAGANPLPPDE